MTQQTLDRGATTPSTSTRRTVVAYGLGALATAAGLGYALADHVALGELDRHLHALYDPVGKYGEVAPLYGYLYAVGGLGLLCWWANLRLVRRGGGTAGRWGWVTLAVATLPVLALLVLREYGKPVIPLSLAAGYLTAWLCGLAGLLAGRSRKAA